MANWKKRSFDERVGSEWRQKSKKIKDVTWLYDDETSIGIAVVVVVIVIVNETLDHFVDISLEHGTLSSVVPRQRIAT